MMRRQYWISTRVVLSLMMALCLASIATAQPPQPEPPSLDDDLRTAIIDSVSAALNEVYIFPDVATEMAGLMEENLDDEKYDDLENVAEFTQRLTEDLQSISHDKHLRISWAPPRPKQDGQTLSDEQIFERELAEARRGNFGFREVKMLEGNIAYIKFDGFAKADYAGATAIAAMNFAGNADAIVFDLRQNGGGSPSMIQLLTSYLVEEKTHLNSFYVRQGDETNQFWTQDWVSGPRLADLPVYVLTSSYTFSAAEEFSYNLKNLERATLVGETTGGGAHPVRRVGFEDLQVEMALPFGRAINPITGTNWEGTGVEPHISVPADEALTTAHIHALGQLEESASDDNKYALTWARERVETMSKPVKLTEKEMKLYAGQYGPRHIFVDKGVLQYQREGRPAFAMIPMGDGRFMFEDIAFFRLHFEQEDDQPATRLMGVYDKGRRDENKRTGD